MLLRCRNTGACRILVPFRYFCQALDKHIPDSWWMFFLTLPRFHKESWWISRSLIHLCTVYVLVTSVWMCSFVSQSDTSANFYSHTHVQMYTSSWWMFFLTLQHFIKNLMNFTVAHSSLHCLRTGHLVCVNVLCKSKWFVSALFVMTCAVCKPASHSSFGVL